MKSEFKIKDQIIPVEFQKNGNHFDLKVSNHSYSGEILAFSAPNFSIKVGEQIVQGSFFSSPDFIDLHLSEGNFRLRRQSSKRSAAKHHVAGSLVSPMPGKVVKVLVKAGDNVKKGDLLMILEAMKMEHKVLAPEDGAVEKIYFKEGDRVGHEVELVKISGGK